MVEVEALTAARRACQRRRKEPSATARPCFDECSASHCSAAALSIYGASSNYIDHGNKDWERRGHAVRRRRHRFTGYHGRVYTWPTVRERDAAFSQRLRSVGGVPALGVLGIVLNLVLSSQMDRETWNFGVFFGSFRVSWSSHPPDLSLVAAANSSSLVPQRPGRAGSAPGFVY